jgi:hypothetical protein
MTSSLRLGGRRQTGFGQAAVDQVASTPDEGREIRPVVATLRRGRLLHLSPNPVSPALSREFDEPTPTTYSTLAGRKTDIRKADPIREQRTLNPLVRICW